MQILSNLTDFDNDYKIDQVVVVLVQLWIEKVFVDQRS